MKYTHIATIKVRVKAIDEEKAEDHIRRLLRSAYLMPIEISFNEKDKI